MSSQVAHPSTSLLISLSTVPRSVPKEIPLADVTSQTESSGVQICAG